ncbi:platelet glycoprotein Ib alpha chain [Synchiropus splendidus]|uniref:platelet glycoprotein Ib alpha chain n=1 Tax=Synchiropus splendidus TaxID=270530 RepID=UPI00237DBC8E|nr:platelet glycoprotein Ib alpha chain [Synchiropus splendidus]
MKLRIFILLALLSSAAGVEGCHSDRDNDHRPRVNCSSAGFSDVPDGLEPTTQVLLFPRNLFSSLSWSSFQTFSELYEIDLTGNKIPSVPAGERLPNLSVLRLGWNRLRSLGDDSFAASPSLTQLELNNNGIRALSDATFSGLGKLEVLDLSHNEIGTLPPALLHPLTALETLYLEYNKIRTMPNGWFDKKPYILYLFLSENPWHCVCPLKYFSIYLFDNENVYVRHGATHKPDTDSVACQTPQRLRQRPVMDLNEGELCPVVTDPAAEPEPSTGAATAATSALTTATLPTGIYTWSPETTYLGKSSDEPVTTVGRESSVSWAALPSTTAGPTHPQSKESVVSYETKEPPASTAPCEIHHLAGRTDGYMAAARSFCFWLFAGSLVLCLLSAVCVLMTLGTLVAWYRKRYKPLKASLRRTRQRKDAVELQQHQRASSAGGVTAHYRSMLFVSREAADSSKGAELLDSPKAENREAYQTTTYHPFSKQ